MALRNTKSNENFKSNDSLKSLYSVSTFGSSESFPSSESLLDLINTENSPKQTSKKCIQPDKNKNNMETNKQTELFKKRKPMIQKKQKRRKRDQSVNVQVEALSTSPNVSDALKISINYHP